MNDGERVEAGGMLTTEGVFIPGDQVVVVVSPAERDELLEELAALRFAPGGSLARLVDALAAPEPLPVVQ